MNQNNQDIVVAKKYAQAFLRIHLLSLSYQNIKDIESIGHALQKTKLFTMYSYLSSLLNKQGKKRLSTCIGDFGFPADMYKLISLLVDMQRLFLLPLICHWIGVYYQEKSHILKFLITSSQPLSHENKSKIEQFLKNYTQASIEPRYEVDPELVAGVRMQSKIYLWEKSIAQQLRDVQLKNMR